jgi:hypothetical protein
VRGWRTTRRRSNTEERVEVRTKRQFSTSSPPTAQSKHATHQSMKMVLWLILYIFFSPCYCLSPLLFSASGCGRRPFFKHLSCTHSPTTPSQKESHAPYTTLPSLRPLNILLLKLPAPRTACLLISLSSFLFVSKSPCPIATLSSLPPSPTSEASPRPPQPMTAFALLLLLFLLHLPRHSLPLPPLLLPLLPSLSPPSPFVVPW